MRKVLLLLAFAACKSPQVDPPPVKDPPATIQSLTVQWGNADAKTLPKAGPELAKNRRVLLVSVEQRIPQPSKVITQDAGASTCFASRVEDVGLVLVARGKNEEPRITEARVRLVDRTWQMDAIAVPEGKVVASWTRVTVAEDVTLAPTPRTMNNQRIGGQDIYGALPRKELEVDCASLQAGAMPNPQADASP